ncbi:MAG: HAMP domain-containing histidine kinase [Kiritimatiellae bacterium]|nr:HAMP domain-containing histidine kinase [Kiritimatiellia bacterium]
MKSGHDNLDTPSVCLRSPLLVSLILAGAYALIYVSYILLSDAWVDRIAASPQEVTQLQTAKGLLFGAVSTAVVFCFLFFSLRRAAKAQRALDRQRQMLMAAERKAAAGILAHSLAHDINNVLTVGMTNVEMLQMHQTLDEQSTEMLGDIGKSFERIHDMARQLSRIGQANQQHGMTELDLAKVAKQELRYIHAHQSARGCSMDYEGPDRALCRANESAIRELLSNLLLNAAEATGGKGKISLRLRIQDQTIVLEVHDNGPGVPQALRTKLFEPLYTTKSEGLGLLSVKSAVKLHRGQIEVTDSPLGGACFRVSLTQPAPEKNEA